ncbi:phosphate transport system protein PhoU [Rhodococcus wratislaviensis IFP 2016]|nr:phosphate transport system protein PhoU [Rhodococcus wratislaviensis IFP 2016]
MMMRMRTKFHEQLDDLTDKLASMCHLAGEAVQVATDALVLADLALAERVFDLNEQIEELRGPCGGPGYGAAGAAGPGRARSP